jgi:hypothetical protein
MAGIKKYKLPQSIDGKSLLPILSNASFSDSSRSLIWHYPNKWIDKDGPGINYYSAIRKGNWKMIYSIRTGKKELYNLSVDIGENNDLSVQNTVKLRELSTLLSTQLRQWKAPMPRFKKTGQPVPFPDGL